ncbi:Nmad2 family putative nucleotide modification protein [Bradyrhizobium australiense]|uniref:Nucleotide modification associated domain-containing protein n=1 Tax=Bradyrhizobium australiense TaxID=2721161 RepID=A0A7Y4GQQ7_9BRAD|nr:hypothetical protein [Bradyrhizobium australiense]NOJ39979.1 hypothetical protein [Bradyrhizobium australiense]
MRMFLYKLTVDAGVAPCVRRGLLSLAICKPSIRTSAEVDDVIFGFAANSLNPLNSLIYIARVTQKLFDGEYYRAKKYAARADCIYEYKEIGRHFHLRDGVTFHTSKRDLLRDLGRAPGYSRAEVLLSADFRYFGSRGTDEYKFLFPEIGRAIDFIGRGHRVNHTAGLRDQLLDMKDWVWHSSSHKTAAGTKSSKRQTCYQLSAVRLPHHLIEVASEPSD